MICMYKKYQIEIFPRSKSGEIKLNAREKEN